MLGSVIHLYNNRSVNHYSPVRGDVQRKVAYDSDGTEFVKYESVDYPALVASRGVVGDWSLDALLKSGVNPDFPIHTSNPTRIEGASDVEALASQAEQVLSDTSEISEE